MEISRRTRIIAAFAAIYIVWGSTYLGILVAIETIPPFLMAAVRFTLAGLILLALSYKARPTIKQLRNAALIGLLLPFVGNGAVVFAETMVPSGFAALLVSITIVWIVIIEWAGPDKKTPSREILIALLLGIIGLVVLVWPSLIGVGDLRLFGIGILLLGSFSWAVGTIVARHIELPKNAGMSTAAQMLAAGSAFFIVSRAMSEHAGTPSLRSILGFFYLVIFGSVIAYSSFVWLLKVSAPAKVATYAYINPVVALFLGWALAGEALSMRTVIASAIIIGAVALITTERSSA